MAQFTDSQKIFVSGLNPEVTGEQLETVFSRYGNIVNIWLADHPPRFAFITYSEEHQAEAAIRALDRRAAFGCIIRVLPYSVQLIENRRCHKCRRLGHVSWNCPDDRGRNMSLERRKSLDQTRRDKKNPRRRQRSRSRSKIPTPGESGQSRGETSNQSHTHHSTGTCSARRAYSPSEGEEIRQNRSNSFSGAYEMYYQSSNQSPPRISPVAGTSTLLSQPSTSAQPELLSFRALAKLSDQTGEAPKMTLHKRVLGKRLGEGRDSPDSPEHFSKKARYPSPSISSSSSVSPSGLLTSSSSSPDNRPLSALPRYHGLSSRRLDNSPANSPLSTYSQDSTHHMQSDVESPAFEALTCDMEPPEQQVESSSDSRFPPDFADSPAPPVSESSFDIHLQPPEVPSPIPDRASPDSSHAFGLMSWSPTPQSQVTEESAGQAPQISEEVPPSEPGPSRALESQAGEPLTFGRSEGQPPSPTKSCKDSSSVQLSSEWSSSSTSGSAKDTSTSKSGSSDL